MGFEFDTPKKPKGVNLHGKSVSCVTCNGDRFVVFSVRPIADRKGGVDELAPCPVCNADLDTAFHRFDGTPVRSPDPARVRQMMQK